MDQIKQAMLSQNKRSTSFPIYIVVEDVKRWGYDEWNNDGKERTDDINYENLCDTCQLKYERSEEIPVECDMCDDEGFQYYKIDKEVPNLMAGFFFTERAIEEHLKEQSYHYNNTARSYVIGAGNDELKTVMLHIVGEENRRIIN